MRSDGYYSSKKVRALDSALVAADADGVTIDRQGYDDVAIAVAVGESGDTLDSSNYILLEVEHSDDGSTWTDCADTDITNTVTGANTGTFAKIDAADEDDTVYSVGYVGGKRYQRLVVNFVGTHTYGTYIGAIGILSHGVKPAL